MPLNSRDIFIIKHLFHNQKFTSSIDGMLLLRAVVFAVYLRLSFPEALAGDSGPVNTP